MAALRKAKKYDWKDSNMALFGTPLEREIKKRSAETEKAWHVVDEVNKPALFIWRIVSFVPTPWPKEDYGKFFEGDSYIILNKYTPPGEKTFDYDVHFWIGKYSTQDEYGTAAYKTVELDTYLDDKPIQHREVQGHESELFQTYFNAITILKGGAESGFRHVTPEKYQPRLLQIVGGRAKVVVKEVAFCQKSLNSDDCFILDFGKKLYQMNGKNANKDEKMKAMQVSNEMRSEHNGAPLEVVDEEGASEQEVKEFLSLLPETSEDEDDQDEPDTQVTSSVKRLYRLSDASGKLEFKEVAKGDIKKSMLDSNDVFIVDTGNHLYVWIGQRASSNEKKSGLATGHNYLSKQTYNPLRPITSVFDGREGGDFFKHAITVGV